MFDTANESQERGQVGIGTLIVFIALVLVAAIAAGVLINTAGFLQTQAEATGEESTSQVSNNVQILSTTGTVGGVDTNAEDGEDSFYIDETRLRVSLAPGSDAVQLDNAEVQLVGPGGTSSVPVSVDEGDSTLTDSGDRATILLGEELADVGSFEETPDAGGDPEQGLAAGDSVDVTITTADGGQTYTALRIPDPLDNKEAVNL